MPAQWLSSSSDVSGRATAALTGALRSMSQPEQARRLRRVLLLLLSLWAVLGLSRLIWALLPASEAISGPPPQIINPVTTSRSGGAADPVDIKRMRAWHLFGEAGATAPSVQAQPQVVASERDGIEKGARETRLNLTLRGIIASTEDGLGHAIIEHQSRQAVYAVEDKLPVSGRVTLAKVMPRQVVLDNGGTYELLVLFEDSRLGAGQAAPPQRSDPIPRSVKKGEQIDKRQDAEATALAVNYRERLYKDPQSLAKVVNVSAVREGGQLLGYSIRPGQEKEQFEQLGFKAGDLVTSVNGIALDNPANTMSLYSAMRSAGEVVFELERGEESLTISVSLDGSAQ